MQNVLIVGNVTKDVYLRMDNRKNHFETDQNNTTWLDLAFDGSAYKFYSRVSIYGGASVSLEVLSRFGAKASICNTTATFLDGQFIAKDTDVSYRYILCQDETVAYLSPSEINHTHFRVPDTNPDWIYIDRSANVGARGAGEILSFLNLSQDTKLLPERRFPLRPYGRPVPFPPFPAGRGRGRSRAHRRRYYPLPRQGRYLEHAD